MNKNYRIINILNDDKTLYSGQVGLNAHVADFQNLVLEIQGVGSSSYTLGIKGSVSKDSPDFTATATKNDSWHYLSLTNLTNASPIVSGFFIAAAAVSELYQVDAKGLRWVNVVVNDYTSGSPYIRIYASNNA